MCLSQSQMRIRVLEYLLIHRNPHEFMACIWQIFQQHGARIWDLFNPIADANHGAGIFTYMNGSFLGFLCSIPAPWIIWAS